MQWLVVALQWLYPLLLLLAAASRASAPSLLYLLAFFAYMRCPPLLQGASSAIGGEGSAVAAAAAAASSWVGSLKSGVPSARPSAARSPAFGLSSSSSFVGGAVAARQTTWLLRR